MPSPSNFDLKLLELLPKDIDGFVKFALICVVVLISVKIYIKRRYM
ncbi:MAG: hypothetical protein ACJAX4_001780 [Clostridium sp.]|jgi:hypothetical protein